MSDADAPIAWLALSEGTSIVARDGTELGKVAEVVADRQKDIFSGITYKRTLLESAVFVPARHIVEITDSEVKLDLTSNEAEVLEPYGS